MIILWCSSMIIQIISYWHACLVCFFMMKHMYSCVFEHILMVIGVMYDRQWYQSSKRTWRLFMVYVRWGDVCVCCFYAGPAGLQKLTIMILLLLLGIVILDETMWWFPEIGVPPVLIHFRRIFVYKPSSYWGTPIDGIPHVEYIIYTDLQT